MASKDLIRCKKIRSTVFFILYLFAQETECNIRNLIGLSVHMCEFCVKEGYPDRGSFCLETGAYLLNLKECNNCRMKNSLKIENHVNFIDDDDVETTHYEHKCTECNHLVAQHEHKFWLEDNFQYYEMNCLLCGEAEDSRSCLPEDPRCTLQF